MKLFALCIGIVLLSSSARAEEDPSVRAPGLGEPARACGHTAELVAAKRALAEGDREGAVHHLERAKALAAACERDASESESRTPASALAKAPAGADGFPYCARSNDTSPRI